MAESTLVEGPISRLAVKLNRSIPIFGLAGLVAVAAAFALPEAATGLVAFGLGIVLIWISLMLRVVGLWHDRAQKRHRNMIIELVANDPSPAFTTDIEGVIGFENAAAIKRFGGRGGYTLLSALSGMFASPSTTLARLQDKALAKGSAYEDVALRNGHLRLSVHAISKAGFLWRLDEMSDRSNGPGDQLSIPRLELSPSGTVVSVNRKLKEFVGFADVTLDRLVADLPLRNGDVHDVTTLHGKTRARVAVIESPDKSREIFFLPETTPISADWNALDALPVALLKIAPDGDILSANRAARMLLSADTLSGLKLGDLVEGLGRSVTDWVAEVLSGRTTGKPEFVRASRVVHETYLQVTLTRMNAENRPEIIAVLSDATELKSLEAQFVQSQKMQAIGQLAGGVAHDFNNLLTAISGHCDLLLLRHESTDPDYADLVQIHQNANRAASLVGQLLAFSRKQTLKPETIDLRDALSDLTHLLNRLVGEKVSLVVDHDEGLLPIRADRRQLEQVIMNLVVNARDAMPVGGEIKVETRNFVLKKALERDRATMPAGDYVLVRVTDQGVGIPQDKLQKVFEPFFTTKRTGEGTGLGLSTAYGIIKQTGGYIFVDSTVGSGTSFSIYLPAYEKAEVQEVVPEAPKSNSSSARGTGVILLVEDEAPVRAFASRALKMRGYTVIEAENAEDALGILADKSLSVDVFVSDVIMPGMDGPSWVSEALKDRPDTKVVFVSGYAEDSFSEQQARIPNSVFLPKPFSLSELTETVHRQFD